MKKKLLFVATIVIVAGAIFVFIDSQRTPDLKKDQAGSLPINSADGSFNKSKYSIDDATSIWVIVNKKRPLPAGYTPNDLTYVGGEQVRLAAAGPLNNLIAAAKKDGVNLSILSSFRSYDYQRDLYNSYVSKDGVADADRYSARPSYSEHQTGLAVDLGSGQCDLQACFGDTPAGKWLGAHAHEHGFIVRYGRDQEALSGYQYEPWHLRYVGVELASELRKTGQTLEQFFGLEPATSY